MLIFTNCLLLSSAQTSLGKSQESHNCQNDGRFTHSFKFVVLSTSVTVVYLRNAICTIVTVSPQEAIVHEGFLTLFACNDPHGTTNLQWLIKWFTI